MRLDTSGGAIGADGGQVVDAGALNRSRLEIIGYNIPFRDTRPGLYVVHILVLELTRPVPRVSSSEVRPVPPQRRVHWVHTCAVETLVSNDKIH